MGLLEKVRCGISQQLTHVAVTLERESLDDDYGHAGALEHQGAAGGSKLVGNRWSSHDQLSPHAPMGAA